MGSNTIDATKLLEGDRRTLAKAITLTESALEEHQLEAEGLLNNLLPYTGNSIRIGISGTPGVGKSTFIEAFGLYLLSLGKKVAVLAVDPSSPVAGGSILGDKTRMENLAREANAFIRPSPSSGALGGVAQKTRETMLLCEAAGFDVVLVETVGVGQSEYQVSGMVDFFLVLMQPSAGDELQGIKKGIIELADALVINKADGELLPFAEQAKGFYQQALSLVMPTGFWAPQVLTCSSLKNKGIEGVWKLIMDFTNQAQANGHLEGNRKKQNYQWFENIYHQLLIASLESRSEFVDQRKDLQQKVFSGKMTPLAAARKLVSFE
jgi:LAO/AO transport system kinase